MNVTSKSRYAFKIMIDLANRSEGSRAERTEIAKTHGIPNSYLDQILLRLKKAGLIESLRGRKGGYYLLKAPQKISVLEIIEAVEDQVAPVPCLISDKLCSQQSDCISKSGWQLVFGAMKVSVASILLSQLVESEANGHVAASFWPHNKTFDDSRSQNI